MISRGRSCGKVGALWLQPSGVDVGSWRWKYSDFKDFSNFFTQNIIEFKRILNAMIFKIYEGELRNFENLHFVVPWYHHGTGKSFVKLGMLS